jgi:hypothetical protein
MDAVENDAHGARSLGRFDRQAPEDSANSDGIGDANREAA